MILAANLLKNLMEIKVYSHITSTYCLHNFDIGMWSRGLQCSLNWDFLSIIYLLGVYSGMTWPTRLSVGSSDGTYARVGGTAGPVVSCSRRTVLIISGVLAIVFIIAVGVPSGEYPCLPEETGGGGERKQSNSHSCILVTASPLNLRKPSQYYGRSTHLVVLSDSLITHLAKQLGVSWLIFKLTIMIQTTLIFCLDPVTKLSF